MTITEEQFRHEIVAIGKLVYQKGWIAANDGNISVRLDNGTILCTPTNVSKGAMEPDDLIVCDCQGAKLTGRREQTSEIALHMTIYRIRPDVNAVLHAHPPVATGFAVAGRALDQATLPEVVIGLGSVPLAKYGLPGTPELTAGMLDLIPKYDAILMANHGCVAYGSNPKQAFSRMEVVEHYARITLVAELLGGPKVLPRNEVSKLFEARQRYGVQSHAAMEPGSPLVAEDLES